MTRLKPRFPAMSVAVFTSCVSLCGLVGLSGCATASAPLFPLYVQLPAPPSEEVREQVGALAVTGVLTPTGIEFTQPLGKGRATAQEAGQAISGLRDISESGGTAFALFVLPLAAAVGAVHGSVAGMNKEDYERVSHRLRFAIQELDIGPRLSGAVTEAVRSVTSQEIISCTNLQPATAPGPPDYHFLADQGAKTVLALTPSWIGLTGPTGVNPPLALNWVVSARLVRVSDGSELFTAEFRFCGERHSLRQWAAKDGRLLRDAINQAFPFLATQIAERLFLISRISDNPGQHLLLR